MHSQAALSSQHSIRDSKSKACLLPQAVPCKILKIDVQAPLTAKGSKSNGRISTLDAVGSLTFSLNIPVELDVH